MEPIRVMDIIPHDLPRSFSLQKVFNGQPYHLWDEGPITSNNTLDVSSTDILITEVTDINGKKRFFAAEGNHRLLYLLWRYGKEVKISNFRFERFGFYGYASQRIYDKMIEEDKLIPDFEEYARLAGLVLNKEISIK